MKDLNLLWNVIKESSEQKFEISNIIEYQKNIKNNFINDFFQEFQKEIGIFDYQKISKYQKYIDYIFAAFKNNFEYTGGKRIRFYHSMYVAFLSDKISDILQISEQDKEIAILSSLFHDIGKSNPIYLKKTNESFKEFEQKYNINHEKLGSEMVFDILKNDFSLNIIEKISNTIIDKEYNEVYSKILHDADNMSELGRMEIYKSFYYNCLDGKDIDFTIDYWFAGNSIKKIKKINSSKFDFTKDIMNEKLKVIFDIYNEFRN